MPIVPVYSYPVEMSVGTMEVLTFVEGDRTRHLFNLAVPVGSQRVRRKGRSILKVPKAPGKDDYYVFTASEAVAEAQLAETRLIKFVEGTST